MMKKYVITGGPGTGKTTLVELLSSRGYSTVVEASRLLIEEKRKIDKDFSPLDNPQLFQKEVIDYQSKLESEATGETVFFDRSIVDNYGYSLFYKMPIPEILEKSGRNRYDAVFLLDPLPSYAKDSSRIEDEKTALAIHRAIEEGYKRLGYDVIKVPAISPERRADFVESICLNRGR